MTRSAGKEAVKGYPAAEGRGTPAAAHAIAIGVDRYMRHAAQTAERGSEGNLQALAKVKDALAAYKTAEEALFQSPVREVPADEAAYGRAAEQWRGQLAALRSAGAALDGALEHLTKQLNWDGAADLAALHKGQVEVKLNKRLADLNELLGCIPADAPAPMLTIRRIIDDEIGRVQGEVRLAGDAEKDPSGVQKQLAALQGPYLAKAQAFNEEMAAAGGAGAPGRDHVYRVRLAMLNRVDARLAEAERAAPPAERAKVIERLASLEAQREALVKRLSDAAAQTVAGGKDAGLGNAQKVGESIIVYLAMPVERYRLLKASLAEATRPPRDWEDKSRSEALAAGREKRVPAVPMTAAEKDAKRVFKPEYDPALVGDVSAFFTGAARLLAAEAEKTFPTVGRRELTEALAKAQASWQEYRAAYLNYWTEGALRELDFAASNWKEFRDGAVGLRVAPVQSRLEDFGDELSKALTAAGATKEAGQVDAAVLAMKRDDFVNRRKSAVNHWSRLSDSAPLARKELLRVRADDFQEYLITTGDNFVQTYWRQLHYTGLSMLEKAAREEIEKATANWTSYQRFPLVRLDDMKPGEADLKPSEVAAVRGMIGAIRGVENVGGGADTLAAKNPPGGDPVINESLEKIRGGDIDGRLKAWLKQASPVLDALPVLADDRGANAQVMKVKATWKRWRDGGGEAVPMHAPPPHLRVSQGGKALPVVRDGNKANPDDAVNLRGQSGEFTVLMPGEPLTFDFGTFLGAAPQPPEATAMLGRGGSWAVLRMLHESPKDATKRLAEGKMWEVQVRASTKAAPGVPAGVYFVTLFLEFEGDAAAAKGKMLPPLADWPRRAPADR
jgi:hypothetical protein